MKKILRGIFIGILAIVVIGGAAAWFLLFGQKAPETDSKPYILDNKGNSYLAVVDENSGETLVAVTDEGGNVFAAKINPDKSIGDAVGSIADKVKKEDLPTNYSGPQVNATANPAQYTGSVEQGSTQQSQPSTTQPSQTQAPTAPANQDTPSSTSPSTTAPVQKTGYRIDKYQDIFAGGTFYMEFTTNDSELGDTPVTAAMKNGNIALDTQMQSMKCKMIYKANEDTTYLVIDNFKKYCKLPKDMIGEDMNLGKDMKNFVSSDNKEITVSNVTINGKELVCESYTNSKGTTTTKYYFDGDTLVRRDNETIENDGSLKVESTFFTKITTDVPDSLFEIPPKYGYLNLSWLEGLGK